MDTAALAKILLDTTRFAEKTIIRDKDFLNVWDIDASEITAGEVVQHIFQVVKGKISSHSQELLRKMFRRGTLASALVKNVGADPGRDDFVCEYGHLARCLAENELYDAEE